jgi:hypothetical protein
VPEYSLKFAKKLADTAALLVRSGQTDGETRRTVLYLSLLSIELSLKAMLEQAGAPLVKIRKRSHDLAGLMRDLGRCKVEAEVIPGKQMLVAASRLRSCTLDLPPAQPTVGELLDAEAKGASQYPNQVRYGKLPKHYPAELVAQMAARVHAFAREHWSSIRLE